MYQNRLYKLIFLGVFATFSIFGLVYVFVRNNVNTVEINGTRIYYTAAITNSEKSVGLSKTDELGKYEGMLFFFNDESPSFWMKDMTIPIDIIWIDNDRVIQVDTDLQPPSLVDEMLRTYVPTSPVDHVLEVNAGFADRHNIKPGDEAKVN
ncbi:DUF192 domain-containing protein [Patescibacteria group bacterium]